VAVSTSDPGPGPKEAADASLASAPGRHQAFEIEPRKTALYQIERGIFVSALWAWFRPKVLGKEHVPATGPVILAPVHRSFADFGFAAFCTKRKLFFMTKDELWKNKWLGRLLLSVGAFPVHRESADREAFQRAEEVLKKGSVLVLFPEGTRREGPVIADLMEGAAFRRRRGPGVAVCRAPRCTPRPRRSCRSCRPSTTRPRRRPAGTEGRRAEPCPGPPRRLACGYSAAGPSTRALARRER